MTSKTTIRKYRVRHNGSLYYVTDQDNKEFYRDTSNYAADYVCSNINLLMVKLAEETHQKHLAEQARIRDLERQLERLTLENDKLTDKLRQTEEKLGNLEKEEIRRKRVAKAKGSKTVECYACTFEFETYYKGPTPLCGRCLNN